MHKNELQKWKLYKENFHFCNVCASDKAHMIVHMEKERLPHGKKEKKKSKV